jgi:hypothetical protein
MIEVVLHHQPNEIINKVFIGTKQCNIQKNRPSADCENNEKGGKRVAEMNFWCTASCRFNRKGHPSHGAVHFFTHMLFSLAINFRSRVVGKHTQVA